MFKHQLFLVGTKAPSDDLCVRDGALTWLVTHAQAPKRSLTGHI